jgi:hypothetical protein
MGFLLLFNDAASTVDIPYIDGKMMVNGDYISQVPHLMAINYNID